MLSLIENRLFLVPWKRIFRRSLKKPSVETNCKGLDYQFNCGVTTARNGLCFRVRRGFPDKCITVVLSPPNPRQNLKKIYIHITNGTSIKQTA